MIDRATTKDPRDRYGIGRRDGPRPRGDAGGRGRSRRRHHRRGDHACSTRCRARSAGWPDRAGLGRRHRDGRGRHRADRRRAASSAAISSRTSAATTGRRAPGPSSPRTRASSTRRRATARRPETEKLAVDGNPTGSAWETEHYDIQDFGGIKAGVGLIVETEGEAVPVSAIEIRSRLQRLGRRDLRRPAGRAAGDARRLGAADRRRSPTAAPARRVDLAGEPGELRS